jgi:hypothetical protein
MLQIAYPCPANIRGRVQALTGGRLDDAVKDLIEHSAQGRTIDHPALHGGADNAAGD